MKYSSKYTQVNTVIRNTLLLSKDLNLNCNTIYYSLFANSKNVYPHRKKFAFVFFTLHEFKISWFSHFAAILTNSTLFLPALPFNEESSINSIVYWFTCTYMCNFKINSSWSLCQNGQDKVHFGIPGPLA